MSKDTANRAIEFYDKFAKRYNESRYTTKEQRLKDMVAKKIFSEFTEEVKNKKILDCGCGPGRMVDIFFKKGGSVTGFDSSKEMLKIAKKNVPQANFIQGSLLELPFKNEEFDVVTCSQVLTHMHEYEKPLREFARVIKKGGLIIIDIRNRYNLKNIMSSIIQLIKKSNYRPHYTTIHNIKKICNKLDLKLIKYYGNDIKVRKGFYKHFAINMTLKIKK